MVWRGLRVSDDSTGAGSAGTRLAALRGAAGLSQRALARRAGVDPETVRRWERSLVRPRGDTVRKVAAALGAPPAELDAGTAADAAPESGGLPPGLRAALALRGVAPGTAGYDVRTLAAAVAARGWRATVEERAPSGRGRRRYQALVFALEPDGSPRHVSGRARGATEAEALAAALVRLLEQTA